MTASSETTLPLWRIHLFGGLRAVPLGPFAERLGLTPVERFRTQKAAALLAYLALNLRRTHTREELADLVWPDAAPENARRSLRVALTSLRHQLEPPGIPGGAVLIADRRFVRLNPAALETDVEAFDTALRAADAARRAGDSAARIAALERAVALSKAVPLLPGFYEAWILAERERWEEAHQNAVKAWEALVAAPPADIAPQEKQEEELAKEAFEKTPVAPPPPRSPVQLPLTLTRFFGREEELSHIADLFAQPDRRLVTLIGPGGVGKTRIAMEAARRLAPDFSGGVWFVPLAELTDTAGMLGAIWDTLRAPTSVSGDRLTQIADRLQSGKETSTDPAAKTLLILDNLEQLGGEAGTVVLRLLAAAPEVRILVTSRRRLAVAGETTLAIAPLPLPGEEEEQSYERLASYPAVALFVDRARAGAPDFQVTPRNAGAIAALLRRLEGIPLAIELCAAWAGILPPSRMLSRLEEGPFDLLTARYRDSDRDARHRSLWAAIGWSYCLLPPDLRRLFARLSVFRGGFTTESVAPICDIPPDEVTEALARLRERSLLIIDSEGRCTLLESLREFGAEQLTKGEAEEVAARHAGYYLALAEQARPDLEGQKNAAARIAELDSERDNLRAALRYLLARRVTAGESDADEAARGALRGAVALCRFWEVRGYASEGRDLLRAALVGNAGAGTAERAQALNAAGLLAARQGDYAEANALQAEALELFCSRGDRQGMAVVLGNLGMVAAECGRHTRARELYEEGLALRREQGDIAGIALMQNNLGNLLRETGDLDGAMAALTEALELRRSLDDIGGVAATLGNLGSTAYARGDRETAQRLHREGFAALRILGDRRGVAYALLNLGEMAAEYGNLEEARYCLEECLPLLHELGDRFALPYAFDSVAGIAARAGDATSAVTLHSAAIALRAATGVQKSQETAEADQQTTLGTAAYARARDRGFNLPLEAAIQIARSICKNGKP